MRTLCLIRINRGQFAYQISTLKRIDPLEIYLFGSLANDGNHDPADIDIAVIIHPDHEPTNFEEKLDLKVSVRDAVWATSMEVPIDLVVYTKSEFERLQSDKWPFVREVMKGKKLYAKVG